MTDAELRDKLAERHSIEDHEWHSCNGISLAPIRKKSYRAGYDAARANPVKRAFPEAEALQRYNENWLGHPVDMARWAWEKAHE